MPSCLAVKVSFRVAHEKYNNIYLRCIFLTHFNYSIHISQVFSFVCVLTWPLLGVKKSLGHAQIGLLQGFNSKFLTSIFIPFICGVAPPEDMSCPSHMLSNCDSKEKHETACSLAPAGYPNKNDNNRKIASAQGTFFFPSPASIRDKEASAEDRAPSTLSLN